MKSFSTATNELTCYYSKWFAFASMALFFLRSSFLPRKTPGLVEIIQTLESNQPGLNTCYLVFTTNYFNVLDPWFPR